jgi:hypothetical protein
MRHPFDLEPQEFEYTNGQPAMPRELEFEETVPSAEAESVGGGFKMTTRAIGEEGGDRSWRLPLPRPIPYPNPKPVPIEPPKYTTLALGEEGGFDPPSLKPPEVTTLAIDEEGGAGPV